MARKYAHLFLVFFLFSCSPACLKWKMTSIEANCPPVTYHRIHSKPCSPFNGLEADFVWNGAERHFYLNACTLLLPVDPDNCGYTTVNLTIEEQTYMFSALLFEGNQRAELPSEAQELVVCALLKGIPVDITIGRFQETLVTDNFPCLYNQIQHTNHPIEVSCQPRQA
jgi:hypothetical protein